MPQQKRQSTTFALEQYSWTLPFAYQSYYCAISQMLWQYDCTHTTVYKKPPCVYMFIGQYSSASLGAHPTLNALYMSASLVVLHALHYAHTAGEVGTKSKWQHTTTHTPHGIHCIVPLTDDIAQTTMQSQAVYVNRSTFPLMLTTRLTSPGEIGKFDAYRHMRTCTHTHHTNITQTHTTYALDWLNRSTLPTLMPTTWLTTWQDMAN